MAAKRVYHCDEPFVCDNCGFIVEVGMEFRYRGLGGGEIAKVHYPSCPQTGRRADSEM